MRINPMAKLRRMGIPNMGIPTPPLTRASTMPGIRRRRTATGPTRLKIYGGGEEIVWAGDEEHRWK